MGPPARDSYAEAQDVAASLEGEGLQHEADALRSAVDGGSMATEILMALRFHLRRIETLKSQVSQDTRLRARSLGQAITEALET